MAPSPAADWYSVGVMLYEALTARLPFEGLFPSMQRAKERLNILTPRQIVATTPADLDDLVMHLLHPDPARRAGAADILRVLRSFGAPPISSTDWIAPSQAPAPFIGRHAELDVLRSAFEGLGEGRRMLLRVEGISGTGKTELVRRALASMQVEPATLVLHGCCHPQESIPYKAFDELVDALSRFLVGLSEPQGAALAPRNPAALIRLFPVLGRVPVLAEAPSSAPALDPQELRRLGFEAMRELLTNVAGARRLVLWIDDLQWGDADSDMLLRDLLQSAAAPPLLMVLSYRSEDIAHSQILCALESTAERLPEGSSQKLIVGPLPPESSRELAEALIASIDSPLGEYLSEIIADSEGSPFFIGVIVRHLAYGPPSGAADVPISARLARLMKDRLERLQQSERRLVEVVSVAGGPLARSTALRAAGIGELGRPDVHRLGKACLLRPTEIGGHPAIETYHDRIREVVVAQLTPDSLRACHRALAEALRASVDPDPDALVAHYLGAGELREAGHYALIAARKAADALAFDQAARMYELAAAHCGDPRERWSLRAKLAEALANAGRGGPAAASFAAAAEELSELSPDDPRAVELRRCAAEQYLRSGYIEEGGAMLRRVLTAVGLKYPASPKQALLSIGWQRVRLWSRSLDFRPRDLQAVPAADLIRIDACWSAGVGLAWVDQIRTAAFQARYINLALDLREPSRVARALATEASQMASLGSAWAIRRSEDFIKKAEDLAGEVADPAVTAFTTLMAGIIAFYRGRWRESLALCRRAEDILRKHCSGTAWEMTTSHIVSLIALVYLGRFAELRAALPELLKAAHARGDILAEATLASGLPNIMWLAGDEPEEARRQADHAISLWPQADFQVQHYCDLLAQTQIDLYLGDAWAGWDRIGAAWPKLQASLNLFVQNFRVTLRHLRARCALAAAGPRSGPSPRRSAILGRLWDRERLLRFAAREAQKLASERLPLAGAMAVLLEASIAASRGRPGLAVRKLGQAADALRDLDMALYAAAARHRQGLLLGGDAGADLVRGSEEWMAGVGIQSPPRMAAMLVPCAGT
jgi:hypothetical protein